jgi:hypothetical protein
MARSMADPGRDPGTRRVPLRTAAAGRKVRRSDLRLPARPEPRLPEPPASWRVARPRAPAGRGRDDPAEGSADIGRDPMCSLIIPGSCGPALLFEVGVITQERQDRRDLVGGPSSATCHPGWFDDEPRTTWTTFDPSCGRSPPQHLSRKRLPGREQRSDVAGAGQRASPPLEPRLGRASGRAPLVGYETMEEARPAR